MQQPKSGLACRSPHNQLPEQGPLILAAACKIGAREWLPFSSGVLFSFPTYLLSQARGGNGKFFTYICFLPPSFSALMTHILRSLYMCLCVPFCAQWAIISQWGWRIWRKRRRQNLTASLQLLRAQQSLPIWSSEFLAAAKQSHNIKSIITQLGDGNASKLMFLCLTAH